MSALLDLARSVPGNVLVVAPIALPILAAAVSLLVPEALRRWVSLLVLSLVLVDTGLLLVRADTDGPQVAQAGAWPAPFGITLVVDRFSALLMLVSAMVLVLVLVYAISQGADDERLADITIVFHPAYLLLASGVCYSFATGDLFNLFVAFEVMLCASYVLITLRAGRRGVRASMTYIVASLLASTFLVSAVGLVYAATGTVNMAQLHDVMPQVPDALRTALAVLFICVFGIKTALFPLHFWLPDSYPAAPAAIAAVFAGLLTKVGVYAIIRTQLVIFPTDRAVTGTVLLVVAGATLLFGILGAMAQNEIKRALVFIIVSHIGFMVMGLGFYSLAGVAGAIFYVVHHIVMQTTVFCVEGLVVRLTGTSALNRISGLARQAPFVAALFALPALSLAGFPPLSGFLGKLALFRAGIAQSAWVIIAVATVVSLLTVVVLSRLWVDAFWGAPSEVVADADSTDAVEVGTHTMPWGMVTATAAVVVMGLLIPVLGGPLYGLCERAAQDLLTGQSYVSAVLGGS